MHVSLVAAGLIATSAIVLYAAVPFHVSPRVEPDSPNVAQTRTDTPALQTRSAPRPSESGTGTLSGEVRDAQGSPIVGAVVDAVHKGGTWRALALTDKAGRFSLTAVPRGEIELTARRDTLEIVKVVTAGSASTNVVLSPAGVEESVAAVGVGRGSGIGGGVGGGVYRPGSGQASPVAPAPMTNSDRVAMEANKTAAVAAYRSVPSMPRALEPTSMDAYARLDPSGFRRTAETPLSTFSVDVDTASYSNGRRFLMEGRLPPLDAVRVEEWVNYFTYDYPAPEGRDAFRVSTALTACPWNRDHQLLRVGVRGRVVPRDDAAPRNLVFLVDVSGSMMSPDKLPLVRTSLRMLADQLTAQDRMALVVYAGRTEVVLPSTSGDQKVRIHHAIEQLEAGGSTNGAGGIQLAYQSAREGFVKGGVNRVVLATDGDFNVGVTSIGELTRLIEKERESGVFLSVLGVGRGNLKDSTLESLADHGNGQYFYVDSLQEARRALVEQVGATLVTIAKDVKLQVEFNPTHVGAYRLIGYENRALNTEDFANDAKDAGEIGAGHTVTALYEIVPPGKEAGIQMTALRYQQTAPVKGRGGEELATVSVRHKAPDGATSALQSHAVGVKVGAADMETAFASAVVEASLVLRKDPLATRASLSAAVKRAEASLGSDSGGWRAEFVRLMQLAISLQSLQAAPTSEP